MLGTDYQGIAIIISAIFAGIASMIAAWNARSASQIKQSISTNGDSREIGQITADTANIVEHRTTMVVPDAPTPAPAPEVDGGTAA